MCLYRFCYYVVLNIRIFDDVCKGFCLVALHRSIETGLGLTKFRNKVSKRAHFFCLLGCFLVKDKWGSFLRGRYRFGFCCHRLSFSLAVYSSYVRYNLLLFSYNRRFRARLLLHFSLCHFRLSRSGWNGGRSFWWAFLYGGRLALRFQQRGFDRLISWHVT